MLIGLNPLLSPDLLYVLRAMGHGDDLVIVDGNYPAAGAGPRVIRLDGISAAAALQAILEVMPLDAFVDDPAQSMQNAAQPEEVPPVVQDFQAIIDTTADAPRAIVQIERFEFYRRAKTAFAIVQTGETQHFGNLILKKGVLPSRA